MWHSFSEQELYKSLKSDKSGLTSNEAEKRINKFGYNELPKGKQITIFEVFFSQFKNPLTIILVIIFILSIVLGEKIDAILILVVVLADVTLGTVQEFRASKSAQKLSELIKQIALVLRDKISVSIDSKYLVPGDIIYISPGDKIPADARILSCENFSVNESILTGENESCYKNNKKVNTNKQSISHQNMVYAGTSALSGRCTAIVVETGSNTNVGEIASNVVNSKEEKSPLVIRMEKFTKQIGYIIIICAFILFFILLYKGYEVSNTFLLIVALVVSVIPEGLPIAITLALSLSSSKMAKENVIVKKLNSVESLGSCTVIATDKTGTLTINEQTAKVILLPSNNLITIDGIGYNDEGKINYNKTNKKEVNNLITSCCLNNEGSLNKTSNTFSYYGDSIDVAFLALGHKANIMVDIRKYGIIKSIPYESLNKYSAVLYKEKKCIISAKGSIEKILTFCDKMKVNNKTIKIDKDLLNKQSDELSSKGYRVIAICEKEVKNKDTFDEKDLNNMVFTGLVGFIDPVRTEVKDAVKECKNAGIKVVMITGDHPLTAFNIAKELNITNKIDEVINGYNLDKIYNDNIEKFDEIVPKIKVFARVTPQQKLQIVTSLKKNKEFVAVTGDGVNDAPALKVANIGISMGSGTDVAKETSTMIITDDNFTSITKGIKEGRRAYNNIRKVTYYLLSTGMAELLFFALAIMFNLPIPLVALQIIYLNLVTDGIQDVALLFEKTNDNVMNDKPRDPNEKIFNKSLITETLLAGLIMGFMVFILWYFMINKLGFELTNARGYVLLLMVFMQNLHALNCRSEKKSIFKIKAKDNYILIFSIIFIIVMQYIIAEVPALSSFIGMISVPPLDVLFIALLALPILIVIEFYKLYKK